MKKKLNFLMAAAVFALIVTLNSAIAGKRYGELKMIEAGIVFFNPQGSSIIDSSGITYITPQGTYHGNDLVYSEEYWGEYPLYFPGNQVLAGVTVTNLGPRSIAKHTLVTEAYVINLDGSNGVPLITPQTQYIEVALGETKTIDASFTLPLVAKGLNRLVISLYHHKNDNNDASLVMQKEGIFCPPEMIEEAGVVAAADPNQSEAVPQFTTYMTAKHYGENRMMDATIEFVLPFGKTVADETGITYYLYGSVYHDNDLVYPSQYWGEFPLYLPGTSVTIKLTATNLGPRSVAKHTLVRECYVLNTDGSYGDPLMDPQILVLEVPSGKTEVIDASFTLPPTGKDPPGLNAFLVSLYHHYNENNDASLVMQKEGIFCPPEVIEEAGVIGVAEQAETASIATSSGTGKHYGELNMLEADIEFSYPVGTTVADATGLTYYIGGIPYPGPNWVYPPEYWGTYPLYYPGTSVPIELTVTNLGPRAIAKHTLVAECFVLNTDGTNGPNILAPQTQYIEVALGETKVINASIELPIVPKGLNRFVISLYHHYNENNDASLVLQKEGIFCPPEVIE